MDHNNSLNVQDLQIVFMLIRPKRFYSIGSKNSFRNFYVNLVSFQCLPILGVKKIYQIIMKWSSL
jgi:hypothetical protein